MTLGEFLSRALEWAYEWWPLRIVRQWEQGVRLYAGTITATLTSSNGLPGLRGVHWFVPRLGEVIIEECNWEVAETGPQPVVTADGATVTVQVAVTWRIRDLRLYYVSIHDQDETIDGAVRASVGSVVPTLAWEELATRLGETVLDAVKTRVYGWGLEVREAVPTTLVRSQALNLLTTDGR